MFVLKKRNIVIISVIFISVMTVILCLGVLKGGNAESLNKSSVKIVLDAGHGGIDNGVVGVNTKVKESELNLDLVKKLKSLLEDAGFSVVLTRSSDAGLYGVATDNLKKKDMLKRKEIICEANPTLVVSIHMNKYSLSTRRGAQVFFKASDEKGKLLANCIQNSFNGMQEAVRTCSALSGDYYILNCSDYPSVIAECGFLSSPEDEALLITEEYRNSLSYAIFKGIVSYLAESSFNFMG